MFLLEGLQAHKACALTNAKQRVVFCEQICENTMTADINAFPHQHPTF